MNTRLQVEHPVTEMITGFDLVEWQLRVAAGEAPAGDAGRNPHHRPCHRGAYLRRGSGARFRALDRAAGVVPHSRTERTVSASIPDSPAGDTVSIHYDAMLAKLICHGATRDEALHLLRRALADTDMVGVASNLDLLGRIAVASGIRGGRCRYRLHRAPRGYVAGTARRAADEVLAAAALGVLTDEAEIAHADAATSADPYSPWHARDQWWLNAASTRELRVHGRRSSVPGACAARRHAWRLTIGDRSPHASVTRARGWQAGLIA